MDRASGLAAPAGTPVRFAALRRISYPLVSLALLAPCYWQPRIQAGDLSSHIYNTWLAGLIESGQTEGLTIVRQMTNILFDLVLGALFRWWGPDWAQRLAVSLAVLIFVWGAFAFVSAVSGRQAWHLLPCIATLAYGWVFHMGFFNFYLAFGLCFWALALMWEFRPWRMCAAAPLFALAYVAHALPVAWAFGLVGYLWIGRQLPGRTRARLMAAALVLLVGIHFAIRQALVSRWSPTQLAVATGADQLWVFDGKYHLLMAALLLIWGSFFLTLLYHWGGREVAASIPLHWCILSAAGVFILPSTVLIPGFQHSLVYISERMSLGVGVCTLALLGAAPLHRLQRYASWGVALIFFVFLFRDERILNRFEDRMDRAVTQAPAGQRVVSAIADYGLRADQLPHMIDRACLGHCYSYANYEPSTAQFRIRVMKENPYVIARYGDSWDLQNGKYVVLERDLPLFAVDVSNDGEVTVRSLNAGASSGTLLWNVLQNQKLPTS